MLNHVNDGQLKIYKKNSHNRTHQRNSQRIERSMQNGSKNY